MSSIDLSQFEKQEYCYLTTRGRITGKPHEIEIWFVVHEGALYLMSGGMDKSDWVKNLLKEPKVTLRIAGKKFAAIAKIKNGDDMTVRNLMADKYRERESDGALSEWASTALVVGFNIDLDGSTASGRGFLKGDGSLLDHMLEEKAKDKKREEEKFRRFFKKRV